MCGHRPPDDWQTDLQQDTRRSRILLMSNEKLKRRLWSAEVGVSLPFTFTASLPQFSCSLRLAIKTTLLPLTSSTATPHFLRSPSADSALHSSISSLQLANHHHLKRLTCKVISYENLSSKLRVARGRRDKGTLRSLHRRTQRILLLFRRPRACSISCPTPTTGSPQRIHTPTHSLTDLTPSIRLTLYHHHAHQLARQGRPGPPPCGRHRVRRQPGRPAHAPSSSLDHPLTSSPDQAP